MTGSLTRRTPKASSTPSRTSRASVSSSTVEAPPRLVSASVCLVDRLTRSPAADADVALGEAGVLDQPRRARLDRAVGLLPARVRRRGAVPPGRGRRGLVKNDPALQVSWSAGSSTMPLPPTQAEHGLADLHERRALPHGHAEGAGELGVLHGRAEVAQPELEGHVEHDVAAGIGLEPAVAVGEAAVGGREGAPGAVDPVPGADAGDGLGDVLAVGPDVLDRGGPDAPGIPDSASMPIQPCSTAWATRSSHPSPAATVRLRAARRRRSPTRVPRVATSTTRPSKPASATTRLEPPPSSRSGRPGGVRRR